MEQDRFARARAFVLGNARLLERRRFELSFDGGRAEAVLAALMAYRNPDGGFGSGLEPDKRDAASQPVDAQVALEVMDEAGLWPAGLTGPLCEWLSCIACPDGGLPFVLPSVESAPHAPWWGAEAGRASDLNPTAAVVGLLLKAGAEHPWLSRAVDYCWRAIEGGPEAKFHTLMPAVTFLRQAPDRARAARGLARLREIICDGDLVELEPDAAGYVKGPLDWAPAPGAPLRILFSDEVIAAHLRALGARQQADGGWPINWEPISPGVELEWRGVMTLQALRTLAAYNA